MAERWIGLSVLVIFLYLSSIGITIEKYKFNYFGQVIQQTILLGLVISLGYSFIQRRLKLTIEYVLIPMLIIVSFFISVMFLAAKNENISDNNIKIKPEIIVAEKVAKG